MAQVFLIMRRTDIPDGVLQVVDLWPNTSSKNYVIDPGLGQTGYVHNIPDPAAGGAVVASPTYTVTEDVTGVSAYLLGHIDATGVPGSAPFTSAQADTATAALVAIAEAGTVLDLAAINTVLGAVVAGTTLTAGGSTGTVAELLSVMAGNGYLITAGTELAAGGFFIGTAGAFVTGVYKQLYDIGRFLVSNLNGNVSLLKDASFTYDNALGVPTTGAAVTVYADDGALFV